MWFISLFMDDPPKRRKPRPPVYPPTFSYFPSPSFTGSSRAEPDDDDKPLTWSVNRLMSAKQKQDYIRSPQWKALRQRRLVLANNTCEYKGCKQTKYLNCHHVTYDRLQQEDIEDLRILCRDCHQRQHDHYGYDRTTLYYPLV